MGSGFMGIKVCGTTVHRVRVHRDRAHRIRVQRVRVYGARVHWTKVHRARVHRVKDHGVMGPGSKDQSTGSGSTGVRVHWAEVYGVRVHRVRVRGIKVHRLPSLPSSSLSLLPLSPSLLPPSPFWQLFLQLTAYPGHQHWDLKEPAIYWGCQTFGTVRGRGAP